MVQKRRTRIIRAPADLLEWCVNSEGSLIILNEKKRKEKKRTLDPRLPALQML
jgi:hypothetical protein